MRFTQSWLAIGALVVVGGFAVDSTAKPSLEERIEHVERLLENKVTIETLNEVELLKSEVQALRGKLDEQQHAIEVLTTKQEKLFLDLERRIDQLPKTSSAQVGQYNNYQPKYPTTVAEQVEHANKSNNITEAGIATDDPTLSEQNLYNEAYKLVDSKRYKDASVALQDFLWKFPEGQYAANANYWLGEIYLSEWHNDKGNKINLEKAINYFKTVTIKYSKHHKAADSLLKLGIIESERENWQAAKEYFTELKQKYPGSSRAHIADARLKNIK
jgi:tol-pal system protein YbgF